ncbi:MAG: hypothetical protein QF559_03460 [Candidatus Nitrosopelagicus sp.]|jgi:hypothetical protein|nr:hypothetical protein [Candidatus Nitrosopelagicus sp.]
MQVKNYLLFSLVAVLLIGGTILPGMAQTETDEEQSKIIINLDSTAYDLQQKITISGQILDFTPSNTNPINDLVEIRFMDQSGKIPTTSYSDDGTLCDNDTCMLSSSDQSFIFKIMPDQLGNFSFNTLLTSVLFNYGTYTIQASTYQSGTIKATTEFEIVAPEEEAPEPEPERIVFETCEIVMQNMKQELASTECSSSNDFLVGDTLVVKGKVALEDRAPGAIPQMITVSIPYPKAMILGVSHHGNYVTTTGIPELLDQKEILTDNIVRILPDSEGNFSTSFYLRNGIFESGLYVVTSTYMGVTVEDTVRVIHESIIGAGEAELSITTDKTEYHPGETVQISGQIMNTLVSDQIILYIESPDISTYNCVVIDCIVDNNEKKVIPEKGLTQHDFSVTYELSSSEAAIGKYTIRAATSVTPDTQTSFFVTEESSIAAVTPSDEELPALKKFIKKFNRISESEISITLDGVGSDSELAPRVIQGSLFTTARGQEADVNIQVSTSNGSCIIGQDNSCMINESTRKPGAIYEVVTIGEEKYKIRYTGTDVRLEKFSILPESSGTEINIKDWNVQILKDEQPTRFYYKVSYVNLE